MCVITIHQSYSQTNRQTDRNSQSNTLRASRIIKYIQASLDAECISTKYIFNFIHQNGSRNKQNI